MTGPRPVTAGDEPTIVVLPDPASVAVAAAERIAAALRTAVDRTGRADWATTGGSTPIGIYRQLVGPDLRHAVPWADVQIWFGDDRFVPRDHPLSNVFAVDSVLLAGGSYSGESGAGESGMDVAIGAEAGIILPAANLHPFPTAETIGQGGSADDCAAAYAGALLAAAVPTDGTLPVFDLVLLGIGPDGHILSVFPGSSAFDSDQVALGIPAPTQVEPHVPRVTLNPAIVGAAREVLVTATGGGKAEILATILGGDRDPRRLPAQLARRRAATWILDEAAAARLQR